MLVAGSGDGLVDAAAAGLLDGHELVRYTGSLDDAELRRRRRDGQRDHRHRLQPRPGPTTGAARRTSSASPRTTTRRARRAARGRRPTSGCRCSAPTATRADRRRAGRARCGRGPRPTASRSPTGRRTGRSMAVDGDPATAWRVADRAPTRSASSIRLDVAEPIDHLTLRQPRGCGRGPPHRRRDDRPSTTRAAGRVDARRAVARRPPASASTSTRRPAPSTVTITIESVVVPDPTIGPALAAVGFAEIDAGLGRRSRSSGRRATPPASPRRRRPVSFVFTRLRTRPTDRWRSDPEPTMVREFELPGDRTFDARGHRAPRPAGRRRRARRAARHRRRRWRSPGSTGVAAAAGWAATDGDPATAWTTPFGGAVGAAPRPDDAPTPLTSSTLTQPAGDHSPITALARRTPATTPSTSTVPPPDADGIEHGHAARAPVGGTRRGWRSRRSSRGSCSTGATPSRSSCRRRSPSCRSARRTVVPDRVDTGCRDDLVADRRRAVPGPHRGAGRRPARRRRRSTATPCGPAPLDARRPAPTG